MKAKMRVDDPTTISPSGDTLFPAHKVLIQYDRETTTPLNYVVVVLVKDKVNDNETYDMLVQLPYTEKIKAKYEAIREALINSRMAIATVSFSFNKIIRYSHVLTSSYTRTCYYATAYNVELIN